MKSKQGNILVIILAIVALLSLSLAGYFFFQTQQLQNPKTESIVPTTTSTVKLKLVDISTDNSIVNTIVDLRSDNGIVCIKAPCPTEEKKWQDRTDNNGYLFISNKNWNYNVNVDIKGCLGDGIKSKNAQKISDNEWILKLACSPKKAY